MAASASVLQRLSFGSDEPWSSLLHAQAYYWTFQRAVENWSWTGTQREMVLRQFPELSDRSRLVLPMIDTEAFNPDGGEQVEPCFLFTTTTSTRSEVGAKGLDPLLRVLPELPEAAKLRLVLHNNVELPDDRQAWNGRVEILTRVPKAQMIPLYRRSLANCRISRADSSPVSLLESMACGVPVVVSPVIARNIPMIVDGENGFVVNPDDAPLIADRLRTLLCDGDLRRRMGSEARRAVLRCGLASNLQLITRYFKSDSYGTISDSRRNASELLRA